MFNLKMIPTALAFTLGLSAPAFACEFHDGSGWFDMPWSKSYDINDNLAQPETDATDSQRSDSDGALKTETAEPVQTAAEAATRPIFSNVAFRASETAKNKLASEKAAEDIKADMGAETLHQTDRLALSEMP